MRRVCRRVADLEDGWCSEAWRRSGGGSPDDTLTRVGRCNDRGSEWVWQSLQLRSEDHCCVRREPFGRPDIEDRMAVTVHGVEGHLRRCGRSVLRSVVVLVRRLVRGVAGVVHPMRHCNRGRGTAGQRGEHRDQESGSERVAHG